MIVNEAAWEKLKKQIEFHTEQDSEITDVLKKMFTLQEFQGALTSSLVLF